MRKVLLYYPACLNNVSITENYTFGKNFAEAQARMPIPIFVALILSAPDMYKKNDDNMNENKIILDMESYQEIAEFWDTHSLGDYWEQTEPVDFQIAPDARNRYLVAVDPGLLKQIQ